MIKTRQKLFKIYHFEILQLMVEIAVLTPENETGPSLHNNFG